MLVVAIPFLNIALSLFILQGNNTVFLENTSIILKISSFFIIIVIPLVVILGYNDFSEKQEEDKDTTKNNLIKKIDAETSR